MSVAGLSTETAQRRQAAGIAPLPLFDCRVPAEAADVVARVLASGQLAAGPAVVELEQAIASELGAGHVVAMSDSTHALAMALHLSGVGRGDDVLVLSFNCLSSTSSIPAVGARPVWVDIDPRTAGLDVEDCEAALTARTRALVVYHVAGYVAQMHRLRAWCDAHGLALIEDANNALGAAFRGTPVGTLGDFSVFSFYPNRQVNSIDGAVLVCREAEHARRAAILRRFGIDASRFRDARGEIAPECDIPEIGMSAPLSHVHAALALHQLRSLGDRLARTRSHVQWLTAQVAGLQGVCPVTWAATDRPAFWVWLIRVQGGRRDAVMAHLKARGVMCSTLHHPNHWYTGFGLAPRLLPGTDTFMQEVLALPCGGWLEQSDLSRILETLTEALRG